MKIGAYEHQGLRKTMEDRHGTAGILSWVADGHGGEFVAQYISQNITALMKSHLVIVQSSLGKCPRSIIEREVNRMFQEMHHAIKDHDEAQWCGSTLLIALEFPTVIIIANSGDSRAIWGKGGRCLGCTDDHNAHNKKEMERLSSSPNPCVFLGRLAGQLGVFRGIGDHQYTSMGFVCTPDVYVVSKKDIDTYVLCSDGLLEPLYARHFQGRRNIKSCELRVADEEFQQESHQYNNEILLDVSLCAQQSLQPHSIAKHIVSKALMRGASDNITLILGVAPPTTRNTEPRTEK